MMFRASNAVTKCDSPKIHGWDDDPHNGMRVCKQLACFPHFIPPLLLYLWKELSFHLYQFIYYA